VTHFDIVSHQTIPAGSIDRFGASQPAEKFEARATVQLDPANSRNQVIVDLDRAPRDVQGKVEFEADVLILRPAKSNGTMIVEFPNRGSSLFLGLLNDLDHSANEGMDQAGNGFLFAKGYTLVVVGWQGDVTSGTKVGTTLPIARGVTGFSRDEWVVQEPTPHQRLHLSWPVANRATAQLFERTSEYSPTVLMAPSTWHFVGESQLEITAPKQQNSPAVYELRYKAKDSAIMGLGFAAVSDVASFLEHDGGPSNPLAEAGRSIITHSIATGISQSGRALRDFLYLGFNRDEAGRRVFDGMLPIVPGSRRTFTNARFAQPGRNPGPEADSLYPVDQFPFTYDVIHDSLSGRTDGILRSCRSTQSCPKVMEFDSEYEFWGARASLTVTDTRGNPIALPEEVRAYMLAGAPHSNPWNAKSSRDPRCALPSSPIAAGPVIRALLVDLDDWVAHDSLPPRSRYPSVADGTLVPASDVYPKGLPIPYKAQHLRAQWIEQTESGPVVKGEYPVLLPKADADGNAVAGIHLPIVSAPRATYVGWNPLTSVAGPQALCDHAAGMIPFAQTKEQRASANDPRLSIDERYSSREEYQAAALRAARMLVSERLLLEEDVNGVVAAADSIE
jgi:hypothetical protein